MNLNDNFTLRAVQSARDALWTASPMPGVERRMLDRVGDEVARATSIVRYAPGTHFDAHVHAGGEEIFVLQGTFSDEHGDYPAGTYLRHPPGSRHAPFSRQGCILFVKLWQFAAGDTLPLQLSTASMSWYPGNVPGLSVMPLHEHAGVNTALIRWEPHTRFTLHTHLGGEEILVLAGLFHDANGQYRAGSWLRSPHGSQHAPYTGPEGALLYVKVGALAARFLTPLLS